MRIRIQKLKLMRLNADADPKLCSVKLLLDMVYSTTFPPSDTHFLYIPHSTLSFGRGGGEVIEKEEGQHKLNIMTQSLLTGQF